MNFHINPDFLNSIWVGDFAVTIFLFSVDIVWPAFQMKFFLAHFCLHFVDIIAAYFLYTDFKQNKI